MYFFNYKNGAPKSSKIGASKKLLLVTSLSFPNRLIFLLWLFLATVIFHIFCGINSTAHKSANVILSLIRCIYHLTRMSSCLFIGLYPIRVNLMSREALILFSHSTVCNSYTQYYALEKWQHKENRLASSLYRLTALVCSSMSRYNTLSSWLRCTADIAWNSLCCYRG